MAGMSDDQGGIGPVKEYTQYVPEQTDLKELTIKSVLIGVIMAMVLGAANAYLGLKAGITVAATFPAAVVGMAVLRFFKGSILEENVARTTGSVGEALAAGAIFTIPAFVITGVWDTIDYVESTAFMLVGGLLGVMFVILLRRILVEESGLPFPESVAASQIHLAGQAGSTGATFVFGAMGLSAFVELFKNANGLTAFREYISYGALNTNTPLEIKHLETNSTIFNLPLGGGVLFQTPSASPALWGVGYIIGPRLASITFSGGVLGWFLFVPLILLILSPATLDDFTGFERGAQAGVVDTVFADYSDNAEVKQYVETTVASTHGVPVETVRSVVSGESDLPKERREEIQGWYNEARTDYYVKVLDGEVANAEINAEEVKENYQEAIGNWTAYQIWFFAVRPFAVGAMLIGAAWTLWSMRKQLTTGIGRAVGDLMRAKGDEGEKLTRYQKDLPFKLIFGLVGILVVLMAILYFVLSHNIVAAIVSALVMTVAGFFFAAVAGYLVGLIGSSNNPISGLTLSTLIIAAVLLVAMGLPGQLVDLAGEGITAEQVAESGMSKEALAQQIGTAWAIGAVLGVASVVCCSCGVAGDMMQDLKVGHILGGTPWKMQSSEIIGVIGAALVMAMPLIVLHETAAGGIGGPELPAPQAGLMAMLSQGIIGGKMAWPLVILGMMFSFAMILIKSPSPMLIAIGMYLPLHTTFAIWVGGILRWITGLMLKAKKVDGVDKENAENKGTLLASGFIAGEALMAIVLAGIVFFGGNLPNLVENPGPELGIVVLAIVGGILVFMPGRKDKNASAPTSE